MLRRTPSRSNLVYQYKLEESRHMRGAALITAGVEVVTISFDYMIDTIQV